MTVYLLQTLKLNVQMTKIALKTLIDGIVATLSVHLKWIVIQTLLLDVQKILIVLPIIKLKIVAITIVVKNLALDERIKSY